jgi:hypothetical protein
MRYRIHKNEGYKVEQKNKKYHIKEIATGLFISEYLYAKEANKESRKFALGRAFNGWTPAFLVDMRSSRSFNGGNVYIDEEDI